MNTKKCIKFYYQLFKILKIFCWKNGYCNSFEIFGKYLPLQLAESSPYFEALKEKDVEILFCYEPYDELVLMQLQQFDKVV